jgi:hypothetical protein
VSKSGHGQCLSPETLQQRGCRDQVRPEHLDRQLAIEFAIVDLKDLGVPPPADQPAELEVGSEDPGKAIGLRLVAGWISATAGPGRRFTDDLGVGGDTTPIAVCRLIGKRR